MKKLVLTTVVVAIALIGFITVLCILPKNNCCHDRNKCEMKDGDGKCSGDKDGCNGDEKCNVRVWTDADGKTHKEVIVIKGGDGDGMCCDKMEGGCSGNMGGCPMDKGKCEMGGMEGKCNMDSMMGGKCGMDKMQMGCGPEGYREHGGCCCCCCMMMMNGMHCNMDQDKGENKVDSPKVKVRGKL